MSEAMTKDFIATTDNSITVAATTEHVEDVTAFVDAIMEKYSAPMTDVVKVNIAIDELYSNIVKYAYMDESTGNSILGEATLAVHTIETDGVVNGISLDFIDSGVPYNPLTLEDPLTNQSLEERDIGGLGLFIVKKQMDDVTYRYEDGHNILTITKLFS